MENEPYRLPRRSQSHGTLRTNFSRHARSAHKPLSRVNENSALLPSSGALGGMLKTTTETGDIGLYSINSVPSTAFCLPSKSRGPAVRRYPALPHLRPPQSSTDGFSRLDSYKRMHPSNRDTTSEIISMYGSTSQSSVTSTRVTSSDEHRQRSQSMTTVGSRHLSHNKSNATLQSQASSGPLQRPRSPFPYPTRLRRPGARPVSPAVTEAGIVDYSRMVEIDRISLVCICEAILLGRTALNLGLENRIWPPEIVLPQCSPKTAVGISIRRKSIHTIFARSWTTPDASTSRTTLSTDCISSFRCIMGSGQLAVPE
jgi:hypothetical protein